ncbi:MAG: VOC family protein [Synechococcaceae cyanobacterium SM2_3_2]|nr:VOC family protein [Synechococcaceae cyanobacterium SM2_3_2]
MLAGLLSLATPDVLRLGSFYRELLDIDPAVTYGDAYQEFRIPGLRLGIYRSHKPEFQPQLGSLSLCLQVQDLTTLLQQPVLAGIPISTVRIEGHGSEVDFLDPDGNRVVLHQPSALFAELLGF